MRFQELFTLCLCLLVGPVVAQDDPHGTDVARDAVAKDEPQAGSSQILVYPASNIPANHLAEILPRILDDDSIRVAADPMSNVLLIRVSAASQDKVVKLLKMLDRLGKTVVVNAYLLKLAGEPLSDDEAASLSGPSDGVSKAIAGLRAGNRVSVATHIELAALENQPSMLQVGGDISVPTGVTSAGPGRRATSYQTHSVGTIIEVSARTTPADAIALTVDFESSAFEPVENDDDEDGGRQIPPSLTRLTHQSTLQLENGHARLSGALAGGTTEDSKHTYIVVSARIAKAPIKQRVASVQSFSQSSAGGSTALATSGSQRSRPAAAKASGKGIDQRYLAYFTKVVAKYDTDSNGKLDSEEWSRMTKDPAAADKDEDGFITPQELTEWSMPRR